MIRFIYDREVVHETNLSVPEFANAPGNSDFREFITDRKIQKEELSADWTPEKMGIHRVYKGVAESGREFVYDRVLV